MTYLTKACRIAESKIELVDFLETIRSISNYQISKVRFEEQKAWSITEGALSHSSGGFFHVIGLQNQQVPSEERLILYQPQSALTGLILLPSNGKIYVLLQARVEPGNTGVIQYGPTIQSTPANYLKLHGGKATAYVNLFTQYNPECQLITHSMQHDLGTKYYQKSKTHHYLLANDWIDTEENMIWASMNAILELIDEDNLLNADLRSLLAVMDWEMYFNPAATPQPFVFLNSFHLLSPKQKHSKISLEKLTDWKINEEGIVPVDQQTTSVHLYHFSCTNREVSAWTQPLFETNAQGMVQLYFRMTDSEPEFLVSIGKEVGISTPFAVYPSKMSLPEENQAPILSPSGKILRELVQCDEGGRFYQNDSIYQLILVVELEIEPHQQWISRSQLKYLLQASNLCSFQLRCVSSLAIDLLNPSVF